MYYVLLLLIIIILWVYVTNIHFFAPFLGAAKARSFFTSTMVISKTEVMPLPPLFMWRRKTPMPSQVFGQHDGSLQRV